MTCALWLDAAALVPVGALERDSAWPLHKGRSATVAVETSRMPSRATLAPSALGRSPGPQRGSVGVRAGRGGAEGSRMAD